MAGAGLGAISTAFIGNDVETHILPAFILIGEKSPPCAGLRCAGRRARSTGSAAQKLDVNTQIVQRL